jgi:hypothetical protein
VTLSVRNRISRRDVVELCEQMFSSADLGAILTRAGDVLTEPQRLDARDVVALAFHFTSSVAVKTKGSQRPRIPSAPARGLAEALGASGSTTASVSGYARGRYWQANLPRFGNTHS